MGSPVLTTALVMATLSAQMAPPYDAFSTFAPIYILLSDVKRAQPTLVLAAIVLKEVPGAVIRTETWNMDSRQGIELG